MLGASPILTEAKGKEVAPKAGLPTVTMNPGKPATITVPKGAKAPTKTVVQPLIEGAGAAVKDGQTVRVAYTGALWKDGSVFDSSANRPEQPYFEFPLGQGQVIPGWDHAIPGMRAGGRRTLLLGPDEGYGATGSPPAIAANDTLVFVIDLLALGEDTAAGMGVDGAHRERVVSPDGATAREVRLSAVVAGP